MVDQERWATERDARRDLAAHPAPQRRHGGDIHRYLAGAYYMEELAHRGEPHAPEQPAPAQRPATGRLVVVGVDESVYTSAVAGIAATEADLRGWPLHLLHASQSESVDHAGELLDRLADQVREETPSVVVTTEFCPGAAIDMLVDRSADAGLLVVGSRGLSALAGVVAGSVSTQLAARASVPLLIVRVSAPPCGPEFPPSIVVGVDGSAASEAAVAFAAAEARLRRIPLTAIFATGDRGGSGPDPLTTGLLQPACPALADLTVHRHRIDEDATRALIEASTRALAVVVGQHGRGGLRGVRLGSTTQALTRHGHCPIFIVPK
jgi:nucleotide-binding universal stress UspA family protein